MAARSCLLSCRNQPGFPGVCWNRAEEPDRADQGDGVRKVIDFECVLPDDENGNPRQSFREMSHRVGYGDPELLEPLPGYGFANYEHIFVRREKPATGGGKAKKPG